MRVERKTVMQWPSGCICLLALIALLVTPAELTFAQSSSNPFAGGWQLDRDSSSLTFQSVKQKDGPVQETSQFANFNGAVDEAGDATITIQLDSIDTGIDLRNVRMRFLFFETFRYPQATVRTNVHKPLMTSLQEKRRLATPIEFELDLHGVVRKLTVNTVMTLFADDQLSIASVEPVSIAAELFNLSEGIAKLQDAAKVTIVPSGSVSFDLVFRKNGVGALASADLDKSASVETNRANPEPASGAALESSGQLTREECMGRFDILSDAGAIYFRTGSSRLDADSDALLATVVNVISRCPTLEIVVEGHTDSAGSDAANLKLSIRRANSVLQYLIAKGVEADRVTAIGFGETRPVAPNNTARNRGRNRRIEFTVTNG